MYRMKILNKCMLMPGRAGRRDALRSGSVENGLVSLTKPWKRKRRYLAKMRKWLKKRERLRLASSTRLQAKKSVLNGEINGKSNNTD